MIPGDNSKKTYDDLAAGGGSAGYSGLGAAQSPAPSEQSLGSGRLTVDAGFLNDDSSNEALVVDFDSPKCSPGELNLIPFSSWPVHCIVISERPIQLWRRKTSE